MEHIWVTDGLIVRKTHVYLAYYPVIYFNNNLSTFTPNTLAVILISVRAMEKAPIDLNISGLHPLHLAFHFMLRLYYTVPV